MSDNLDAVLDQMPTEVGDWRFAYEYPGVWTWYNEALPNGWLAATPFWGDDHSVPVDWMTLDGEVFQLGQFEYQLTGDNLTNASNYVDAMQDFFTKATEQF